MVRHIPKGMKRQWVQCLTCKRILYYDYTPFDLSSPIFDAPCGHSRGRLNEWAKCITADTALRIVLNKQHAETLKNKRVPKPQKH